MNKLKLILPFVCLLVVACRNNEQKQTDEMDTLTAIEDTAAVKSIDTNNTSPAVTKTIGPNPNNILVNCEGVGKIKMDDNYESIVAKVGKQNITQDSVFVKGKFQGTYATKVWKGTAGEITINWQESQQPFETIQNIIIDEPKATYVVQNGIKMGSPLSLINKLNGKPVSLIGFAGNNAGTMMSFNGGNLTAQIPCIRAVFALPKMTSYPKEVKEILTPNIVSSAHTAFRIYDPTLVKLIINANR